MTAIQSFQFEPLYVYFQQGWWSYIIPFENRIQTPDNDPSLFFFLRTGEQAALQRGDRQQRRRIVRTRNVDQRFLIVWANGHFVKADLRIRSKHAPEERGRFLQGLE